MPEGVPLYSCNIFAYIAKGAPGFVFVPDIIDDWWTLVLRWSWFDQSQFSWLAWVEKSVVKQINLGPMFDNPYFTLHPHEKPLQ